MTTSATAGSGGASTTGGESGSVFSGFAGASSTGGAAASASAGGAASALGRKKVVYGSTELMNASDFLDVLGRLGKESG